MTKKELLDILLQSTLKDDPKTAALYKEYVPQIEKLLHNVPDDEEFYSRQGNEPQSIKDFPKTQSGFENFLRSHRVESINQTLHTLMSELQTWEKDWFDGLVEEYYQSISSDKNGEAVKRAIDGETISHWASLVPALFGLLLSIALIVCCALGIIKEIDYDAVGFILSIAGASALIIFSVVAKIVNVRNRKKFKRTHKYSLETIVAAKNRNNGKKSKLASFKTTGLIIVTVIVVIAMVGLSVWYFIGRRTEEDFEYEGFSVSIHDDNKTATVRVKTLKDEIEFPARVFDPDGNGYDVTAIGKAVMSENDKVVSVNMPTSIQKIEEGAFTNFSSLEKISLPESVAYIGNAFQGCLKLKNVNINDLQAWCKITFEGAYSNPLIYAKNLTLGKEPISGNIVVEEGVVSIPAYTFFESSITRLELPDSVTEIGESAFTNCKKLSEAILSPNITSLPEGLFSGCSNLQKLTLPFVGETANISEASKDGLFGSIFGTQEYDGSYAICQYYDDFDGWIELIEKYPTTDEQTEHVDEIKNWLKAIKQSSITYYIPKQLQEITIMGGGIPPSAFLTNSEDEDEFETWRGMLHLSRIKLSEKVKRIGQFSFMNCGFLTEITIPDGITSIENGAFIGCSGLISIEIPNGVTSIGIGAFGDCSGLKEIVIPNSVASIGKWAFSECKGLESLTIGSSVTSIGEEAFYKCTKLATVWNKSVLDFEKGNAEKGYAAYYAEHIYTIDSGTGQIATDDGYLFDESGTPSLVGYSGIAEELILPDTTPHGLSYGIAEKVFQHHTNITSVTISDGVTSIGNDAFNGCGRLESVTIGSGVTSIGDLAFNNCSRLTAVHIIDLAAWCAIEFEGFWSNPLYYAHHLYMDGEEVTGLKIPDGVTSIGDFAFYYCTGLTSITIPDGVTSIGRYTFSLTAYYSDASHRDESGVLYIGNHLIAAETTISGAYTIRKNTKTIAGCAFYNCSGLTSIEIPVSVTSIGEWAFYNCSGLESIEIPVSVTSIGSFVFWGCSGLTSISIPDSVTSIGKWAFNDCSRLTSIVIPDSVLSIGAYAFDDCSSLTIYCEASEQPSGWDRWWNLDNRPVVWGYKVKS